MKHVHFVLFFFFFFLHVLHCHKRVHYLFVLSNPYIVMKHALFEPVHGITVLIAYANSEGSGACTSVQSHQSLRIYIV